MTVPNNYDVTGEQVFDYDVVWKATRHGALNLAVVKNVKTPFQRINPSYSYRNPTGVPRHITGIEDKVLYLMCFSKPEFNKPLTNSGTVREHGMTNAVKIVDPYILNSQLVADMREKAMKLKK